MAHGCQWLMAANGPQRRIAYRCNRIISTNASLLPRADGILWLMANNGLWLSMLIAVSNPWLQMNHSCLWLMLFVSQGYKWLMVVSMISLFRLLQWIWFKFEQSQGEFNLTVVVAENKLEVAEFDSFHGYMYAWNKATHPWQNIRTHRPQSHLEQAPSTQDHKPSNSLAGKGTTREANQLETEGGRVEGEGQRSREEMGFRVQLWRGGYNRVLEREGKRNEPVGIGWTKRSWWGERC